MKLVWIALALALAACSKSSDRSAGSNAASAAVPASAAAGAVATEAQDRCEVHITGSQTLDIIGTKPRGSPSVKLSAGSEYWMTEDELRNAIATMVSFGDKRSKEEIDRKVDEEMKKDPRLWLLMMNCSTDEAFVNLSPSSSSKSADIPFGPHAYVIASDPKAGEF